MSDIRKWLDAVKAAEYAESPEGRAANYQAGLKEFDRITEPGETPASPDKSEGHLGFCYPDEFPAFEFFTRGEEVYRASLSNPVMPDGYRCGRWETNMFHWNHYQKAKEFNLV